MKQEQSQQDSQSHNISREMPCPAEKDQTQTVLSDTEPRQIQRCANCDIEFFWSPTRVQGNVYCCSGCAAGGPCTCDYSLYRSVMIMGVIHYEP